MDHAWNPSRAVRGTASGDMTTGERSLEGSDSPAPGRPMDDNAGSHSRDQPTGARLNPAPKCRASPDGQTAARLRGG